MSGAKRAIKYLNKKKILVIVITNQSGIARKYFKMKDVKNFHSHMNYELKKNEAHIDDFFVCGCHPLYPTKKIINVNAETTKSNAFKGNQKVVPEQIKNNNDRR